jgi:tetratricopeptide (TPR) repeat protein
MAERNELSARIKELVDQRLTLETQLQNEKSEISDAQSRRYDDQYNGIQRQLAALFRTADEDAPRITIMLELMRILENRLVYLQHFVVEPTADHRVLAQLVTQFIDQTADGRGNVLTNLEATYYRAVAALYAGDLGKARQGFRDACASEESDEANDIKYKSYVMLGHLSHEEKDYAGAKQLHHESLRYSNNNNVTAQALALKALNSYALGDYEEALHLFEESLQLFDGDQPFFNSYFFRNALLFCGAIWFDRKDLKKSAGYYQRVVDNVEAASYDAFDALSHLGRIHYLEGHYAEAATALEQAVQTHRFSENEYVVDTWFWIARAYLKRDDREKARGYLEKIVATEVAYEKKPQAVELLQRIA